MSSTGRKVSSLSDHVNGRVVGDGNVEIERVASLEAAGAGDISYVEDKKFFEAAQESHASCLIVPKGSELEVQCKIEVKNPKLAFALIAEILHPRKRRGPEIHSSAVIAQNASIGRDAFIGAFVCIGEGSRLGDRSEIRAGAKIGDGVIIGADCLIHPNVFIDDRHHRRSGDPARRR
jgi:UDP-3-O-[3-hydroxymyristoyl] glucosamine N-acyltransferase